MDLPSEEPLRPQPSALIKFYRTISQRYQSILDASTPHVTGRWVFAVLLLIVYMARVLYLQGWYIITYALGIYYLNLFIAFLTPKIDPALNDDLDDGPSLPTTNSEEFRPFIRRLPEFKFWYFILSVYLGLSIVFDCLQRHSSVKATVIALFCTCFEAFNIPVFWPILLLYFFTLFCITMKRQIKHMIKYHYLPWTRGKTKYRGKEDTGKVVYTNSNTTEM